MAKPCYTGPNPADSIEDRMAIWKWAKENGIDQGMPIEKVGDAINDYFFAGQGKPEWINDILAGRKTPLRQVSLDMWRKQYNRRVITQQAQDTIKLAAMGKFGKTMRVLWSLPRSVAVAGHGIVFPITHGGDLIFRPESWGTLIKGALRTYRGAFPTKLGYRKFSVPLAEPFERLTGKAVGESYVGQMLSNIMQRDPLYSTALKTDLDVGPRSHPSGLISRTFRGPAARAWDMLTLMRFELWKKQMGKFMKPGMSEAELIELGSGLAKWANHATGSGKGFLSGHGAGEVLFGPKLTQAKINRLSIDPVETARTLTRMAFQDKTVTPGERAVAWTRLSGATQYLVTNLGFLAVNQGFLKALGSKDQVNYWNPFSPDYFAFKGNGLVGNVPGLHSEIRALSKLLTLGWLDRKQMAEYRLGNKKFGAAATILGQYALGKGQPGIEKVLEGVFGEDWRGRPLPWSKDRGTKTLPQMSYGEYAASLGPIPLEGPSGYVFDHLKKTGMSRLEATKTIKGLIMYELMNVATAVQNGVTDPKAWALFGAGAPGFHVHEEHKLAPKKGAGLFRPAFSRPKRTPNLFAQ